MSYESDANQYYQGYGRGINTPQCQIGDAATQRAPISYDVPKTPYVGPESQFQPNDQYNNYVNPFQVGRFYDGFGYR